MTNVLDKIIKWGKDEWEKEKKAGEARTKRLSEFNKKLQNYSDKIKADPLSRLFMKKCPRCDGRNINVVKPSLFKKWTEGSTHLFTLGLSRMSRNLNVCRDCGFSWEDR